MLISIPLAHKMLQTFLYLLFAGFLAVECLDCPVGTETNLTSIINEPDRPSLFRVQRCQNATADRCLLVNVSFSVELDPPS